MEATPDGDKVVTKFRTNVTPYVHVNQLQLSESQTNQSVQIMKYSHQSPFPNLVTPLSNIMQMDMDKEDTQKSQQM